MGEWIDFDRWQECASMERPGIVFEVTNAEAQSLLTNCVVPLDWPFDWTSPPTRFRLVIELPPTHSNPIPEPAK